MGEQHGIKETTELAQGLIVLGAKVLAAAKKAKADGKVDWADAPIVLDLAQDKELRDAVSAGVEGVDKVKDEIADLSGLEVAQLVTAIGTEALKQLSK